MFIPGNREGCVVCVYVCVSVCVSYSFFPNFFFTQFFSEDQTSIFLGIIMKNVGLIFGKFIKRLCSQRNKNRDLYPQSAHKLKTWCLRHTSKRPLRKMLTRDRCSLPDQLIRPSLKRFIQLASGCSNNMWDLQSTLKHRMFVWLF